MRVCLSSKSWVWSFVSPRAVLTQTYSGSPFNLRQESCPEYAQNRRSQRPGIVRWSGGDSYSLFGWFVLWNRCSPSGQATSIWSHGEVVLPWSAYNCSKAPARWLSEWTALGPSYQQGLPSRNGPTEHHQTPSRYWVRNQCRAQLQSPDFWALDELKATRNS